MAVILMIEQLKYFKFDILWPIYFVYTFVSWLEWKITYSILFYFIFFMNFIWSISESSKIPTCKTGDVNCIKESTNVVLNQFYGGKNLAKTNSWRPFFITIRVLLCVQVKQRLHWRKLTHFRSSAWQSNKVATIQWTWIWNSLMLSCTDWKTSVALQSSE